MLSIEEEAVVVAFRRHTLLPLDDCLYALQPTIPHLTRSSLHRCLQRHGISRLPDTASRSASHRAPRKVGYRLKKVWTSLSLGFKVATPIIFGVAHMEWPHRIDNYVRETGFPRSLFVAEDNRIVGTWIMGNDYRVKSSYYGGYPAGYLRRVRALFPDKNEPFTYLAARSI